MARKMNHTHLRVHHGLQVISAIGSSVQSFQGPCKSFKIVIDGDEDGVIATSCMELLQALDIQHPVGDLVLSTCLTHHKIHGSGEATLITMAAWLGKAVQSLLDKGVPASVIKSLGDVCMQHCIETAQSQTIQCKVSLPHTKSSGSSVHSSRMSYENGASHDNLKPEELYEGMMQMKGPQTNIGDDFIEKKLSYSEETLIPSKVVNVTKKEHASNHVVDDVSWYFEDAGGQYMDPNADLDQYKSMVSNLSDLSDGTIPLPSKSNDLKTITLFKCEKQSKEQVSSSNFNLLREFDFHKIQDVGADDHDFDDCFSELQITENPDFQIDYNIGAYSKTDTSGNIPVSTVQRDDDSDDDFKDCFLDESGKQDPKAINNFHLTNNTFELKKCPNKPTDILQPYVKPVSKLTCMETSPLTGKINTPFAVGVTSGLLDTLGHSISNRVPIASSKLLNNSRHFRTEESVVEEHDGIDQGEDTGNLGHSKSYGIARKPLNDSSHFKTDLESAVDEHDDVDQGKYTLKIGADRVQPADTSTEDNWSTNEHLQHLLEKKVAHGKENLHTGAIGQSRHFRTIGQQETVTSKLTGNDCIEFDSHLSEDIKSSIIDHTKEMADEPISDIWVLGDGLSHGADREMRLAIEAYINPTTRGPAHQHISTGLPFDFESLFVCCITGPSEKDSCMVEGLVLPVSKDQIQHISSQLGNSLNCLLINGDLKPTARHTGYKESIKAAKIHYGNITGAVQENDWILQATGILNRLQINMVMTKGQIDGDLLAWCAAHGIIMLQHVPYKALIALMDGKDIVTYITDATEDDRITDISLSSWECGWQHRPTLRTPHLERTHFVTINSKQYLQTAVITSSNISGILGAEDQFWRCIHRLVDAMRDESVLPGNGAIECVIIKTLNDVIIGETRLDMEESGHQSSWHMAVLHEYTSVVAMAFKDAFMQCVVHTLQNSADNDNSTDLRSLIEDFIKNNNVDEIAGLYHNVLDQFDTDRNKSMKLPGKVEIIKKEILHSKSDPEMSSSQYTCDRTAASDVIFDSYASKMAAWQGAWELVKTVLQADVVLICGIDKVNSLL